MRFARGHETAAEILPQQGEPLEVPPGSSCAVACRRTRPRKGLEERRVRWFPAL